MIVDKKILEYEKYEAKKGDFITYDGYIFMIVEEDNVASPYRLLRIRDGHRTSRDENIENTIVCGGYSTIHNILEDPNIARKSYKIIRAENMLLKLI